jgi:DNA replication and repair protein RecF
MFLRRLSLTNFRNHNATSLEFKSRLIFFIGNNGEGKTNLLESISVLSYLKSFRESDENQLLLWDSPFTFIKAEFEAGQENFTFEYGIEKAQIKRKRIKINGELIKRIADSVGYFRSVIMSPPDLKIIDGGNVERRKFLDSFISSTNPKYLSNIIEYNHLLKQRNAALKKEFVDIKEVEIWNQPLIERESDIGEERQKILTSLSIYFQKNLLSLSQGKDNFFLSYKPNVANKEDHLDKLKHNIKKDIAIGYTSCGNHRDDVMLGFDGKDLSNFGSQGQKRSAVIALKTACFQLIKDSTGEAPVLLIDDVIRELDVKRREYFIDLISECGQAFFTTTDLEGIREYIGSLEVDKEIYQIENGIVTKLESL